MRSVGKGTRTDPDQHITVQSDHGLFTCTVSVNYDIALDKYFFVILHKKHMLWVLIEIASIQ